MTIRTDLQKFYFQSNNRIKAMRRQLDEAEEEISREKAHRRKVGKLKFHGYFES